MNGAALPTTGLRGPTPSECVAVGKNVRYRLPPGASTLDPLSVPLRAEEEGQCLKTTSISMLKGQGMVCAQNAKLMAVNLRYIAYAMKEGFLRVINQNAKDIFKLHNSTKAVIMDVALNGGVQKEQGTTLLCVDEAARVSLFVLEAYKGQTHEERTKMVELEFPPSLDPPLRILGHPSDTETFVTLHASHLSVWSLLLVEGEDPRERSSESGFATHVIDDQLAGNASQRFAVPHGARLLDATLSVDARCLVALTAEALYIWRLRLPTTAPGEPELLQRLSVDSVAGVPSGLHSVHALGAHPLERAARAPGCDGHEVLVLRSGTGCQLLAYGFSPSAPEPVGPLLQSVTLASSDGDDAIGCADVNSTTRDSLGITYRNKAVLLVLPLARGWSGGLGLPFPYAQRFVADEPAQQLSIMTGKPYQLSGQTLFMYRAHNFTRPKDGLLGCHISASEVLDAGLVAREDPPAGDAAAGTAASAAEGPASAPPTPPTPPPTPPPPPEVPETVAAASAANGPAEPMSEEPAPGPEPPPQEPAPGLEPPPQEPAPELPGQEPPPPPEACGLPGAPDAGDGEEAALRLPNGSDLEAADAADAGGADRQEPGATGSRRRRAEPKLDRPDLDWGFVKQIAASFVHGLDKRKGEMAQRVLSEVSEVVKSTSGSTTEADAAVFEQALAKLREAREAQSACERNLQAAARKATDSWAEASTTAVTGLLQNELGKISDGVAATLAQQLSQSKKFSEALARGVQKSGGVATKQALEALRPKQLQETVGTALTEALHKSLAPVFRAELRHHFEQELAPLIERRLGEMMGSFRDSMARCLESIAAEHEQAGQRLGCDLAPVVAEELRQVERIAAQHRPAAAASGALSEAQLDELAAAVQVEIVQPMHARIQELTAQVQTLRVEAQRLEERWQSCRQAQAAASRQPAAATRSPEEREEEQAAEIEGSFRDGVIESALIRAMHAQEKARHCDFLDRLCVLVPEGSLEEWLAVDGDGGQLKNQVKMFLMLSLAKQLEDADLGEEVRARKIEWITELWFVFDPTEQTVAANAASLCAQLIEELDRIEPGGCSSEVAAKLRKLRKGIKQSAKLLRDK